MRIVLDTNILVRANVKAHGPAREALLRIISGNHVLITSPFLLREVERALAYPRLQKLWRLSFPLWYGRSMRNTGILPVANHGQDGRATIVTSGKADALCTLDSDFFEPGVVAFCRNRGISILTDVMLLQRLMQMP